MKRFLLLFTLLTTTTYAQLSSYTYKQELKGVKGNTWHKLTLPDETFAQFQSYGSDLRIYGVSTTDTIEVPYTVIDTNNIVKHKVDFSVINSKETKCSYINFSLPQALRLCKLRILPQASYDYYRKLNLATSATESYAQKRCDSYCSYTLKEAPLSSKTNNTFSFDDVLVKYGQIIIENGDNEPLPINEVIVYAVRYTLAARFLDSNRTYYLAYGKEDDYTPEYDIEHFITDIPKQLTELEYGKVVKQIKTEPSVKESPAPAKKSHQELLWWVMGFIVALIFIFSAKMMKR
ncbi:hypothetical protein RCZ04_07990 [Capnocytophaga sp. HP1101]